MNACSHAVVSAFMLAWLAASPALAEGAPSSRYTRVNLEQPQCTSAPAPVEGFSCMGVAGWTLNVGFPAFGATLNFSRHKGRVSAVSPTQGRQVEIDGLAGKTTTIEWRGTTHGSAFEPYAAIIRVLVLDARQRLAMIEQGSPPASARRAQILMVTRLGREGSCVVAYVDAQANPKPNDLARAAADTAGKATTCPVEQVDIRGVETPVLTGYIR
ncbi:hypothetical protein BH10PSE8_BH10PSE8_04870 [soil metagenome]